MSEKYMAAKQNKKSFRDAVFGVVKKIPVGQKISYAEVARRAGNPRAYRAVGNILNKNYDPRIPCHRVIRSDGSVGRYNRGLRAKKELLRKESAQQSFSFTRILSGEEKKQAVRFFEEAAREAKKSTCDRDACGSVIVQGVSIVGQGYNSPPLDNELYRRCQRKHELPPDFKSDKTCCQHAEVRAILDALRKDPKKILGATLYFTRVNRHGKILFSGKPYCTICSKMALDVGIFEFVLWHERGIYAYETGHYKELSYQYRE